MVDYNMITGTLVQSFGICKRQTWLMAHQIIPDQEHEYISLGRLIDEDSYSRNKRRIRFENIAIDLIESADGDLIVGEVKKSSKGRESAKMQLAYYLYRLKESGVQARGQLLFPKERRRENVELTKELEQELEEMFSKINDLIQQAMPPSFEKIGYCKNCGYKEFCWA